MSSSTTSVDKIVQGAIRALGRQGVRKFSMSDVCDEAGVSRGTLYRYFKSREQVLEAVGEQVERSLRTVLNDAVQANPDPGTRLEVVLHALLDYGRQYPETVRIAEAEPGFVLGFLTREFPTLLAIVADALEPALRDAPPVRDGSMTKRQLAEIFLRLAMSVYLLPTQGADHTAERVGELWRSMLTAQTGTRHPRQARTAG